MSSEQVDPIFAPLHNQLLKKWKNYRPIIAAEVPTWASASSFAFTCEGESLDFRGSMEWLRDKSKSSGKKTRLKAPLYWLNVADYFHKIKDLTGFPPLLVRKALFYDNFPEEPPSKESHNTRALKNWIELGEIMQFLLSKNLGFLLCAAVLSQADLNTVQTNRIEGQQISTCWIPKEISEFDTSLLEPVRAVVARMRKTQDNILAPGNSLFSNPNPRSQLLPHHKTRLSYDSLFAIAESLSCLGHIFPKRIVEDAVYDQTWSKDGTVSFSPSRINFEAVDLLKTSEVITQIDEHGFEFSIRKDPVFQEQMIQQASETCKWEERRWQQLYKMNCKATSFFPQSRYNAMRYIIYSFPEDLQIAALWVTSGGRVMIPYLEQCLGDFSAWERQTQGTGASDVIGQSPIIIENSEELFRFVKILVTASFFGSPVSKCRAINIATTLCKRLPQTTFEALSIRVQLRKWSIQRLYKCFDTVNSLQEIRARLDCALISTTSQQLHMNVLMGQYVLQRSQEAMDEGKFEEALYILAQYRSLESQREALLPLLIHIARADVLRLQGKFDESRKAYWATLTQYHPLRTVKLMRKIAAVACESGAFSEACRVVSDMMGKRFPSVIEPEKLAFADYHLMLGIWKWRQCLHNPSQPEWKAEEPNFNHAANVYRAVVSKSDGDDHTNTSMMATRNRAWAMIGLAIISHASDTPTLARKLWRAAEAAIQGCFRFWSLHYVQAIILYSLADLSIEDVDARKLIEDANSIYNGRQMYFTGLGTVWADILCVRASKAKRLISLSNSLHHTQGHTSSESLGWHPGCCAELLATS